jgi:iron complex transport system permease protein
LTLKIEKIEELLTAIKKIGTATGCKNSADKLIRDINNRLNNLQSKFNSTNKPKILWVVQTEPLRVAGRDTFINELIELAGGENAIDATIQQYPQIGTEQLLACLPEVIIQSAMAAANIAEQQKAAETFWSRWPSLKSCPRSWVDCKSSAFKYHQSEKMSSFSKSDKTMLTMLTPKKLAVKLSIALLVLAAAMLLCTLVGTQKISLQKILAGPAKQPGQNIDYEIFSIRLQRVTLAALVGAALACCGVVLQAILRNPLADPYILGISSGAGLGAIIAVLSGITWTFWAGSPIAVFAFAGATLTVWLVWCIGHLAGKSQVTSLLLAGVVINAFFSAVIMFLTSIARSEQLRSTIYWLMGSITEKDPAALLTGGLCILAGIIGLFSICHRLNILTLGEDEAKGLGVDTAKTKVVAFGFAAFITAVAVSLSGLIGFVGLIVPHGARLVFGPDHRQLLPLSAIIGGTFLVIADTIARAAFGQEQLPVGVITAIAGGPFFLILLAKYTRKMGTH